MSVESKLQDWITVANEGRERFSLPILGSGQGYLEGDARPYVPRVARPHCAAFLFKSDQKATDGLLVNGREGLESEKRIAFRFLQCEDASTRRLTVFRVNP